MSPTNSNLQRSLLEISNSPQPFNIYLTTDMSDLWVTSSACSNCSRTPGFSNASSSTFQATQDSAGQPVRVMLNYSTGIVAGDLVQDTVAMGSFQLPHQPWLLVDQTPAGLLTGSSTGFMGLAFDTVTNLGVTPFWQALASAGLLATPEMSLWLTRLLGDQNAQVEDFGGIFTLGGQNQSLYTGDVEFLPLVTNAGRKTYWILNVSGTHPIRHDHVVGFSHPSSSIAGITVDKKNVTIPSGGIAYFFVGTTLIGGPTAGVSAIYPDSQLPAA